MQNKRHYPRRVRDIRGGVLRTKLTKHAAARPAKAIEDLKNISRLKTREQALEYFCMEGAKQAVLASNKRAFLIAANIILIRGGGGFDNTG